MNLEEYAQMYRLEDTHWWFVARRRLLARALQRFLPPAPAVSGCPRRFLDIGCGTGGTMDYIKPLGEVVGVDTEPLALAFCRKRGYRGLILGDATALPLADSSFDAVVALDVLEHIPDHQAAAREIYRVLAPGGLVFVSVPAYRSLWSGHDVALMHQRRYIAPEIEALLRDSGLNLLYRTYTLTAYLPLVWAIRQGRKRLSPQAPPRADVSATPPALNWLLRAWLDLEGIAALRVPMPFGLSVFVIAQKSVACVK